jgi:hypothetical protein
VRSVTVKRGDEQVSAAIANQDAKLMALLKLVRVTVARRGIQFSDTERFSAYELNKQLKGRPIDERMEIKSLMYQAGLIEA